MMLRILKNFSGGFGLGAILGALWLLWVYRRAEQFPGDPALNGYTAWLRGVGGQGSESGVRKYKAEDGGIQD